MNGFVLWHKITISSAESAGGVLAAVSSAFGFGLPITISNSVYGLGLVLDADVSITAREGATATTFTVTVYNLPDKDISIVKAANRSGALAISISLGYLDNPATIFGDHPVLRGVITNVDNDVADDGRGRVVIKGEEETGHLLLATRASGQLQGKGDLDDVVRRLLDAANNPPPAKPGQPRPPVPAGGVKLAKGSTLGATAKDFTVRTGSILSALAQLTEAEDKALVVGDGVVAIGAGVGVELAPVAVQSAVNVVKLGSSQEVDPGQKGGSATKGASGSTGNPAVPSPASGKGTDAPAAAGRTVTDGLIVTVLGHPGLRVGQKITTDLPDARGDLRVSALTTTYSTKSGYVCELTLSAVKSGARAPAATPAGKVIDQFNKAIIAARQDNPTVDVGEVTGYTPADGAAQPVGHRVTMHYAQVPEAKVKAPSTDSPVSTEADLPNKPMASVFAFDKVGLVTPVYPGMRALLVHNRSLTNDAVVAGWLWPSQPASTVPPNKAGDWWLALPTELDGNGRPTGKGVNDLIDARGLRVLQARGLHIVVGASALPSVGTRPSVPNDDTLTIEHSSGTTITIASDGAVSVTTKNKALTLGNGRVSLTIDGTSVAVK